MASLQVRSPYVAKPSNLIRQRGRWNQSQSVLLKTLIGGTGITLINNADDIRILATTSTGESIGDIDLSQFYTKTQSDNLYYNKSYLDNIINSIFSNINTKPSTSDISSTYLSIISASSTYITQTNANNTYSKIALDSPLTLGTTYTNLTADTNIINWSNAFANINIAGRITANTLITTRVGNSTNTPASTDKFEIICKTTSSVIGNSRGGIAFMFNSGSGADVNLLEIKTYAHPTNGSLDLGIKTRYTSNPSIYIKDTVPVPDGTSVAGRGFVGILNINPTVALDVTGAFKVSGESTLSALTASGLITANLGLTVPANQTLTVAGNTSLANLTATGSASFANITCSGTGVNGFYSKDHIDNNYYTRTVSDTRLTNALIPYYTGGFIDLNFLRISNANIYLKKEVDSLISLNSSYSATIDSPVNVINFNNVNANIRTAGTISAGSVSITGLITVGNSITATGAINANGGIVMPSGVVFNNSGTISGAGAINTTGNISTSGTITTTSSNIPAFIINDGGGGSKLQVGNTNPACLNSSWPCLAFNMSFNAGWSRITSGSPAGQIVMNNNTGNIEFCQDIGSFTIAPSNSINMILDRLNGLRLRNNLIVSSDSLAFNNNYTTQIMGVNSQGDASNLLLWKPSLSDSNLYTIGFNYTGSGGLVNNLPTTATLGGVLKCGIGMIPVARGSQSPTTYVLANHINTGAEWVVASDGWKNLLSVRADTGDTIVRGRLSNNNLYLFAVITGGAVITLTNNTYMTWVGNSIRLSRNLPSNFYNTSNGRFTITQSGIYMINFHWTFTGQNTIPLISLQTSLADKAGNVIARALGNNLNITMFLDINTSDYYTMIMYQNSGSNQTLYTGAAVGGSYLTVAYIG